MKEEFLSYGIVGGGAIGQALALALQPAQRQVLIWDKEPAKSNTESLQTLSQRSQVIILAVPSFAVRTVLRDIKKLIPQGSCVLTLAKGVEPGFVTMSEVLEEELGDKHTFGVICGPMLAEDITKGLGGSGILALSDKHAAADTIVKDFERGGLHLSNSPTLEATCLSGVLKNIYSLGLGMLDGLDAGTNRKAALTVQSLEEMRQIMIQVGNHDEYVVYGLCGLGDLLATGWGESSRNRQTGQTIADGKRLDLNSEGLNSLREIDGVLEPADFPIINCLRHIVLNNAAAEQLLEVIR